MRSREHVLAWFYQGNFSWEANPWYRDTTHASPPTRMGPACARPRPRPSRLSVAGPEFVLGSNSIHSAPCCEEEHQRRSATPTKQLTTFTHQGTFPSCSRQNTLRHDGPRKPLLQDSAHRDGENVGARGTVFPSRTFADPPSGCSVRFSSFPVVLFDVKCRFSDLGCSVQSLHVAQVGPTGPRVR